MRHLLTLIALLTLTALPLRADPTLSILGQDHQVRGLVVSKSGLMRPIDLRHGIKFSNRTVYVPAGLRMVLTGTRHKQGGRRWSLAVLENGLAVWVRDGRSERISNYIPTERLTRVSGDLVAIPQTKFKLVGNLYTEVWPTPSEVYAARLNAFDQYEIRIDADKMGDKFTQPEWIAVPEDRVAVLEVAELTPPDAAQQIRPWEPFDTATALQDLVEAAKSLDAENVQAAVQNLFSRRLITAKACNQTISFDLDMDASAALKARTFFTGELGGLGLSTQFHSDMEEGPGVAYAIDRFRRHRDVVEVKSDRILRAADNSPDCQDLSPQHQIVATSSSGETVRINSDWADRVGVETTDLDLPAYACRDQYLKLIHNLTTQQAKSLPEDVAGYFVSIFVPYSGSKDPSQCPSGT